MCGQGPLWLGSQQRSKVKTNRFGDLWGVLSEIGDHLSGGDWKKTERTPPNRAFGPLWQTPKAHNPWCLGETDQKQLGFQGPLSGAQSGRDSHASRCKVRCHALAQGSTKPNRGTAEPGGSRKPTLPPKSGWLRRKGIRWESECCFPLATLRMLFNSLHGTENSRLSSHLLGERIEGRPRAQRQRFPRGDSKAMRWAFPVLARLRGVPELAPSAARKILARS